MRVYPFDVRAALLKSGRKEFLKQGFELASLRVICKNAGVTTGAFYSYFQKKEDLFAAIVEPTLKEFHESCCPAMNRKQDADGVCEMHCVEFMVQHREEFLLLFDCSRGTAYENFQEELLRSCICKSYQRHIDSGVAGMVEPGLVTILLRMKFEEYRQLLYGEYTVEQARKLVKNLTVFTDAGFLRMMESLQPAED